MQRFLHLPNLVKGTIYILLFSQCWVIVALPYQLIGNDQTEISVSLGAEENESDKEENIQKFDDKLRIRPLTLQLQLITDLIFTTYQQNFKPLTPPEIHTPPPELFIS